MYRMYEYRITWEGRVCSESTESHPFQLGFKASFATPLAIGNDVFIRTQYHGDKYLGKVHRVLQITGKQNPVTEVRVRHDSVELFSVTAIKQITQEISTVVEDILSTVS